MAATPVVLLLGVLPPAYIVALAGLAILPSLQNALEKAFETKLRFGAVVAFVVSASSFSLLGIGSGFWALITAMLAMFVAERQELFSYWRNRPESDARDARIERWIDDDHHELLRFGGWSRLVSRRFNDDPLPPRALLITLALERAIPRTAP